VGDKRQQGTLVKGDIQGEIEVEGLKMPVKSSELDSINGKVVTPLFDYTLWKRQTLTF
jgi:hypothetical protein